MGGEERRWVYRLTLGRGNWKEDMAIASGNLWLQRTGGLSVYAPL